MARPKESIMAVLAVGAEVTTGGLEAKHHPTGKPEGLAGIRFGLLEVDRGYFAAA